ncbi:MAG: GAF domain-containing protein, partial [Bacteroidales bacterium]|nr:GAF domain-containing protein [Bacteroidales bacterium]
HLHEEEIREKEAAAAKSLWYNEGIVKFSELISTNKENIRKLASSVLRNLISYVEANQGGIFLLDDKNMDEKTQELLLIASHAYTEDKLNNQRFMPGEGLIGTCYQNGEVIRIDNLPDDYSQLASGLGKSSPKHLVLVPVSLGDYKIGVLELISFNPVDDYKVELVEKVTESLASIVSIVRANEQALTAVNLVNEQKEELLAQEEEIRQNLEEMQATQDELLRKQDSLLLETAMLETLLDFLPERITIKDANGVYLRVNKTKLEALKLKKMEDIKGLTDKDFFGEEHFKKALEAERALMQSANPILNNEEQLRFSDGRVQWGSTSRIPFRNARGEMVGTITITKNISELKLMSGKLEGLTTLLRGIAGTQALICYETDQKGIILQIFGRGLDLIGQEQSELENTGIFTLFDELKQEVDLENPKEEYAVNYRLIVRKTAYRISHRILRNASSGGLVGCAEVEVERTTQSHTPQARQ